MKPRRITTLVRAWVLLNLSVCLATVTFGKNVVTTPFWLLSGLSVGLAGAQVLLFWWIGTVTKRALLLGLCVYALQVPVVTLGVNRLSLAAGLGINWRVTDAPGPVFEVNLAAAAAAVMFLVWLNGAVPGTEHENRRD